MKILEQIQEEESNVYSLFVYAVRSQVTRDYYLRRLKIFFNHINLEPEVNPEDLNIFDSSQNISILVQNIIKVY